MPQPRTPIRELAPFAAPIYVPWFALTAGIGIVSLALPLYLIEIGFSFTRTALVLLATGLGAATGGIFVGAAIARVGERAVTLTSLTVAATVLALLGTSESLGPLFVLVFVAGVAIVGVRQSGQAALQRGVRVNLRGRAMSGVGGTRRIGAFLGPVVGGILIDSVGFTTTFVVAGLVALLGVPPRLLSRVHGEVPDPDRLSMAAALRRHWRRLLRTTGGPTLVMVVRSGRAVVLPLISDDIGLTATQVGVVVGVSTGADLLLFPLAGHLMDRYGRLVAIVPAFTLMGLGLLVLAVAGTGSTVAVAGAVIGVGNGLSSGSLMTLGSDLAPDDAPAQFMAAFASMNDTGEVFGPLLVGVVADAMGLGASALALAVAMFVGIGLIVTMIGETNTDARPISAASD